MGVLDKALTKFRKQAGIPPIPRDATPEQRQFFQAIRENLAVRMGQEGDPMQRAVTFADLADGGALTLSGVSSGSRGGGGTSPTDAETGYDYSPPPALTGLEANGGFDVVFLAWDNPGFDYNYFVEIWRSSVDALDLSSSNTKLVGRSNSALYVDYLNGDQTQYYYWVRAVKAIGNRLIQGAFNATAGTLGEISLDPSLIIGALEGQLTESELAAELLTPISAIPTMQEDIQTIGQTAGDAYSAVQTKAEASVVTDLEGEVTEVKARYSIKLDANGRMSGLIFGDDGTASSLVIASNSMFFVDPGQSITPFNPQTDYSSMEALRDTQLVFGYAKVEGYNRFVINAPAYIPEGYITTAMVKNATINQAQIVDLAVSAADIDIGNIWQLTIGGEIRSGNFSSGSTGWRITQGGNAEFSNATVRGHIEANTGRINNNVIIGSGSKSAAQLLADTQIGEDAKARVDSWEKPGTTYIAGSSIFADDVYVDTVNIRGQAVTFARGAYTEDKVTNLGGTTAWRTVQQVYVTRKGAPIIFWFDFDYYFTAFATNGYTVYLRVVDSGGTVLVPSRVFTSAPGSNLSSTTASGQHSGVAYATGTGDANRTVYLQTRTSVGVQSSSYVRRRNFALLEAKR